MLRRLELMSKRFLLIRLMRKKLRINLVKNSRVWIVSLINRNSRAKRNNCSKVIFSI